MYEQGVHYFFERVERRVNVCGQFVIVLVSESEFGITSYFLQFEDEVDRAISKELV